MIVGAVMLPHPPIAVAEIGRGEEKKIQTTLDSFAKAAEFVAEKKPDTIIVTTPHMLSFRDCFNVSKGGKAAGDFADYMAKKVSFAYEYDGDFSNRLNQLCLNELFPAGVMHDHAPVLDQGTMVPLYFIRQKYNDFKLVRIGLSGLSLPVHYHFGQLIQQICMADDKRYLILASGDLSHCEKEDGPYGYQPEGPVYDARIMKDMGSASFGNLLKYEPVFLEKAQECGHRSFTILGGILDQMDVKAEVLSHEATFGVGYGAILYEIGGRNPSRDFLNQYEDEIKAKTSSKTAKSDPYVALAVKTIGEWVKNHQIIPMSGNLPKEMLEERAGAFVSIHEHGELRGCIGTISATRDNLAMEIIHNAISACSRDPRFDPVRANELPFLEVSVDILGEAEAVTDRSQLDVKRYGVIVSTDDGRRGLLLPNLDGVDTIDEQISIALRKGGISESEPYTMERFEVVRHE